MQPLSTGHSNVILIDTALIALTSFYCTDNVGT